jgi:hypothetical protein
MFRVVTGLPQGRAHQRQEADSRDTVRSADFVHEHALGDDATLTRASNSSILNSVLKIKQNVRTKAEIELVNEYGTSAQKIAREIAPKVCR